VPTAAYWAPTSREQPWRWSKSHGLPLVVKGMGWRRQGVPWPTACDDPQA